MSYSIPLNDQYTLLPPTYNNNDPLWRGAGDPRPEVQGPSLPDGQIVIEEGTPYVCTLNTKEIRSNGKQLADSVTESDISPAQPYLSLAVPPTVKSADRTYPSGNAAWPQGSMVLKDKCTISLPEFIDITAPNTNTDPNRYFHSFEFNLASAFETPSSWVLVWQAWQQCVKRNPVLTMNLALGAKTDPVKANFYYADDKSQNEYHEDLATHAPVVRPGQPLLIQSGEIKRDIWHKIKFQLRPAYNDGPGGGKIIIWLDDVQLINWAGDWGYKPTSVADQYGTSSGAKIWMSLGIYRGLQPRLHKIAFRNVKFSKILTEV
jgi:hypothetical protein